MKEIWKDIKNFEGLYQVSNIGRVRSLTRKVTDINNRVMIYKGKILKQLNNGRDYLTVQLRKNDKRYVKYIHRLVAETFIGEIKNNDINHKDFNRKNNNVDNLEICSRLENIRYSLENGKYKNIKKYNAKSKVERIKQNVINDFKNGMLKQDIYKKYKIDGRTLKKYGVILKRQTIN